MVFDIFPSSIESECIEWMIFAVTYSGISIKTSGMFTLLTGHPILNLSIVTCEFTFAGEMTQKDTLLVLYLLSKGVNVLEVVRRGLQINMS